MNHIELIKKLTIDSNNESNSDILYAILENDDEYMLFRNMLKKKLNILNVVNAQLTNDSKLNFILTFSDSRDMDIFNDIHQDANIQYRGNTYSLNIIKNERRKKLTYISFVKI